MDKAQARPAVVHLVIEAWVECRCALLHSASRIEAPKRSVKFKK